VKWKDYGLDEAQWVKKSKLNCDLLLKEFEDRRKKLGEDDDGEEKKADSDSEDTASKKKNWQN